MKTLNQLSETVKALELENVSFSVIIREDEYENTSDANYYENTPFDTLKEAFDCYAKELKNISTFESASEYKEIELVATTEDGDLEILESETFVQEYSSEDYGKFLMSFRPKKNGIEGVRIEVINESTKFQVSADGRYSTKFEIYESKDQTIKAIYDKMLYISMEEATEIFELSI